MLKRKALLFLIDYNKSFIAKLKIVSRIERYFKPINSANYDVCKQFDIKHTSKVYAMKFSECKQSIYSTFRKF